MLTKEGLERKIIKGSNEMIYYYANNIDNDIFGNDIYKDEIEKYKKVYYNYEEACSIMVVYYINKLLDTYYKNENVVLDKYAFKLGIFDFDDKIIKCILDTSIYDLNFYDYWDKKVQQLYELIGYKDILPNHSDIIKLETLIHNKKKENDNLVEILELQKKLDLKKCAIGELENQFDDDMPVIFSDDIIENYDNYIICEKRYNMVKSLRKENRDS